MWVCIFEKDCFTIVNIFPAAEIMALVQSINFDDKLQKIEDYFNLCSQTIRIYWGIVTKLEQSSLDIKVKNTRLSSINLTPNAFQSKNNQSSIFHTTYKRIKTSKVHVFLIDQFYCKTTLIKAIYCIKVDVKLDQFLVQIQQLGQHTPSRMSEEQVSPVPKVDKKSSIKKSLNPDQSKSKKKPVGFMNPPISEPQDQTLETTLEEKPQPKSMTRSSKRSILEKKNEQTFIEHMKQAEKSEKCGKIMKSINRSETIKEGHNNLEESNQRQFSLSKKEDQTLDVSKKKIATESKKNKRLENDSTHPKTEEKVVSNLGELQKQQVFEQNVEVPAQNQKPSQNNQNEVPLQQTLTEIKPTQSSGKNMKALISNVSEPSNSKGEPSKDGELSKKRNRPIKSYKETEEVSQDSRASKSVSIKDKSSKKPWRQTTKPSKSKNQLGTSGVKRMKPNEQKNE